jgi:glycine oxidase
MPEHPDVLIIGGGVIGLTTAYFLAREHVQVTVVDKGDFGQEASWAGAGILPPGKPSAGQHPYERLRATGVAMFPALSVELRERTGIDNGYLRSGGLDFSEAHDASACAEWRADGVAVEMVEGPALARLEPLLAADVGSACYLPDMAQVRNPRHLKALLAGCAALGVTLRPGCAIHSFERRNARLTGVRTDHGVLSAGRYLIAAGAWSDSLLEPLGWRPGIRPIRGQIALLNTGTPKLRRILVEGKRYLVPRPDGRVLVGSTEEDVGFDKHNTAAAIANLLELAQRLVPSLARAHLERSWAGLRPGSPDGLPFLGPVPGIDNLFVAAGHFRAGIQLSPATALALTETFLGKPLTVPLEPFRLDRKSVSPAGASVPVAEAVR